MDQLQMQGVGLDTLPDCQKTTKCRRKSRWKLKFHHQALPAEYLDHYEASLMTPTGGQGARAAPALPPPQPPTPAPSPMPHGFNLHHNSSHPPTSSPGPTRISYHDLPYMGEMTLDNARPRRGRKPKKADICHLIYKNYGTTVVDEPLNLCVRDLAPPPPPPPVSMCKFKFTGGPTPSLQEKKTLALDKRFYEQPRKKSRKSLAREKLEQTFKERGFLIQTQHLESAQGATYCKFRQLRKFTRYLFRSWKHHLPGEIVANQMTEPPNS